MINPDETPPWLVLGDSLSDGLWSRDPQGVGSAWPGAARRLAAEAGIDLKIRNRSRGGSRSIEVLSDLRNDPESARGHSVAILVGANDLWRRWVPWEDHEWVDPDDFCRGLRRIVSTCRENGALDVVLMTPCLLHADLDHPWNQALVEYREAVGSASRREEARLVPSGEEFLAAARAHREVKWTYDGVHPRPVGHERLAWSWLHHVMGFEPIPAETIPPMPSDHKLSRWP